MINFFERAQTMLYNVATYNIAGNYPWGGVVVSACAFPLIMIGRMLYLFSIDTFYTLSTIFLICFLGALQLILESVPSERRNTIVINRFFGMLICFYYVPLQLKFIIISLFLFHVIRSVIPHVILAHWNIDIEAHNGLTGLLGLDITAGIIANIFMQTLRLFLT